MREYTAVEAAVRADKDATRRLVGRFLSAFGYRARRPLFIIGTGRCGSSLLTRILMSHASLAVFPEEANELWHPNSYPFRAAGVDTPSIIENPRSFTDISLSNWPRDHDQRIRDIFTAYNFIHGPMKTLVVKSAMISFMIPKILSLFPGARLCHIYRSGPPVVESLVVKDWSKYSDRFPSRSDFRSACARYWNDCIVEIDARNAEFALAEKGILLEFSYEALCAQPDAVLRRLAAFLGVAPGGFRLDAADIQSQDYKVGDYAVDPAWSIPMQVMAEAMALKGFTPPT
jgi:hypothetical protein